VLKPIGPTSTIFILGSSDIPALPLSLFLVPAIGLRTNVCFVLLSLSILDMPSIAPLTRWYGTQNIVLFLSSFDTTTKNPTLASSWLSSCRQCQSILIRVLSPSTSTTMSLLLQYLSPRSRAKIERPDNTIIPIYEDPPLKPVLNTVFADGEICLSSNQKTRNQFRPRAGKGGVNSYQLRQYAEVTLGGGSLRKVVKLPEGEDENEWLAVNSEFVHCYYLIGEANG
jgi:hypothetical protein